jgi:hypothetical protein
LADALSVIAKNQDIALAKTVLQMLPWPIAALVDEAQSNEKLREIAGEVRAGGRGDFEQWQAAELRWAKVGICEADVLGLSAGSWFGASVERIGMPYCNSVYTDFEKRVEWRFEDIFTVVQLFAPTPQFHGEIAQIVGSMLVPAFLET